MPHNRAVRGNGSTSHQETDEFDARSVAIAARHNRGLRHVSADSATTVLALLLERRWQLVSQRQRALCQLHALLTDMIPAGAKRQLTCTKATRLLRSITPGDVVELERKLLARQMLADIRGIERRIPVANRRLEQALALFDTTLTGIVGISTVGAATILSIVDDPTRFATAGHFAGFTGTAPLQASPGDVERHRLSGRGNRQINKVLHSAAITRSAYAAAAVTTTTANAARARAPRRPCARSSDSCPTWSIADCSPTTSDARWPGVDR